MCLCEDSSGINFIIRFLSINDNGMINWIAVANVVEKAMIFLQSCICLTCFLQCQIRPWDDKESKGKIRCCAIVVFVEFMECNAAAIRNEKVGIALGLLRKRGEGWL